MSLIDTRSEREIEGVELVSGESGTIFVGLCCLPQIPQEEFEVNKRCFGSGPALSDNNSRASSSLMLQSIKSDLERIIPSANINPSTNAASSQGFLIKKPYSISVPSKDCILTERGDSWAKWSETGSLSPRSKRTTPRTSLPPLTLFHPALILLFEGHIIIFE